MFLSLYKNWTNFSFNTSGRRRRGGRKRVYFRRRYRRLIRGRGLWIIRYRRKIYRLKTRGGRFQVYFRRKWRSITRRRRRLGWKVLINRRWLRVRRRGRRWYLRSGRRNVILRKRLRLRFGRKYRPVKTRGRRYVIHIGRQWIYIKRKTTWKIRLAGRYLRVKKRGRNVQVRFRGKYKPSVLRRPKPLNRSKWNALVRFIWFRTSHCFIYLARLIRSKGRPRQNLQHW